MKFFSHAEPRSSRRLGTAQICSKLKVIFLFLAAPTTVIEVPGAVLKEIRKEDKSLKFIILTFYAYDPYRKSAVKAGVDYFFSKVDDFDQVMVVVKRLLEKETKDNEFDEMQQSTDVFSNELIP